MQAEKASVGSNGDGDSQDTFIRGFEFVFYDDNKSSRTRVNKHVQKERYRKKRFEERDEKRKSISGPSKADVQSLAGRVKNGAILSTSSPFSIQSPSSGSSSSEGGPESLPSLVSSPAAFESSPARRQSSRRLFSRPSQAEESNETASSSLQALVLSSPKSPSPTPRSLLGAGSNDPFSSYPIPSDPEIDWLVDQYANALGPYLYGYAPQSKFDIFRDRSLALSIQEPIRFHSMLLLAGSIMNGIQGQPPGARVLYHRNEAIHLVNKNLGDPAVSLSDGTLFAVTILTYMEYNWGDPHSLEVHSKGMRELIIRRGGLHTLSSSPRMEFMLHSILLATPGILFIGSPNLYTDFRIPLTRVQEQRLVSDEFINFLKAVLALASTANSPYENLSFAFGPGSAVHKLLTAPSSQRLGYKIGWNLFFQQRCRLATLLHVHAMLLRQHCPGHPPDNASLRRDAAHFQWVLAQESIWGNSLEMLQDLVVREDESTKLMDPECSWKVLRLMEVADQLSPSTRETVQGFLLDCLGRDEIDILLYGPLTIDVDVIETELLEHTDSEMAICDEGIYRRDTSCAMAMVEKRRRRERKSRMGAWAEGSEYELEHFELRDMPCERSIWCQRCDEIINCARNVKVKKFSLRFHYLPPSFSSVENPELKLQEAPMLLWQNSPEAFRPRPAGHCLRNRTTPIIIRLLRIRDTTSSARSSNFQT